MAVVAASLPMSSQPAGGWPAGERCLAWRSFAAFRGPAACCRLVSPAVYWEVSQAGNIARGVCPSPLNIVIKAVES